MSSEVVCTGAGLSTWLGDGAEHFWRGLLADDGVLAQPPAGLRDDSGELLASCRRELMDHVVAEALKEAGVTADGARWLVLLVAQADHRERRAARLAPLFSHVLVPEQAEVMVVSHACASVGFAVASARTLLRSGRCDRALVLGSCVPTDYDIRGMAVTRALARGACRPFDVARDGTTIGCGAGALLLERAEDARRRGAAALARIAGVACRVGAGSRAGLDRDAARHCIELAVADAATVSIDYVHAHATGTRAGDEAELAVLAEVGARGGLQSVPVSSHKGRVGHLLHCSMFPGVVVALRALRDGIVPGTPGLRCPIRGYGLSPLLSARRVAHVRAVLVNGFGFCDNNAALVLARERPVCDGEELQAGR
jgi:3-oxoacyl-[acyl-carrier-protein] synthase II